MGRPRKVTDEQLMAACGRAIGRYGPRFTLAQVAHEAGVATATVAERFGSKQALLETMLTTENAGLADRMRAAARAAGASGAAGGQVGALRAAALVGAEQVADAATAANHLAQLGADLADPALRAGVAEQRDLVRGVLTELAADAAGAGELPRAPSPEVAARVLAALVHGAQVDWAMRPDGSLIDRLLADVDAVLSAWGR
ncbi:TetR family transcriptional regulator [Jiangella alkaliphila]|uniref:Regulatory protein, tetR family n=1 Tax=Jiangella alkaliphila TaxID=419479 RepID=A0A1H2IP97_9ACTN|nr:TetR family transcriptional regulator C-terminal domain-containing protein [Jiangella alkaliphila]SDU45882.1 regulatory protein, tetR family [Jiangella alkaliphila]